MKSKLLALIIALFTMVGTHSAAAAFLSVTLTGEATGYDNVNLFGTVPSNPYMHYYSTTVDQSYTTSFVFDLSEAIYTTSGSQTTLTAPTTASFTINNHEQDYTSTSSSSSLVTDSVTHTYLLYFNDLNRLVDIRNTLALPGESIGDPSSPLSSVTAASPAGTSLTGYFDAPGVALQLSTTSLTVSDSSRVSTVPIPASLPMFASGLVALAALGYLRERLSRGATAAL